MRCSSIFCLGLTLAACSARDGSATVDDQALRAADAAPSTEMASVHTVFVILMENHNWSSIKGNASAPYINHTLLPQASHAENYSNPLRNHPSEPNYLWLESGSNLGVINDNAPALNHQSTTDHLVTRLEHAGLSWKTYQEGIDGATCPLTSKGHYNPKHNPFVFFDDVTGNGSVGDPHCIAHVRPYPELANDLQSGQVANYVFITPDLCDDMHGAIGCPPNSVANGDRWLSTAVPQIMASPAYTSGGALFITWDESEGGEFPIGMIVLSPFAKGGGYSNTVRYTHSSMLRTVQTIFGLEPFLRDAANATDLGDLFGTAAATR